MQWNADQGKLEVHRQGDTGQEVLAMTSPCLVTCSNDMNDPRIPSLKGIMASKKKVIETLSPPALTGKAATTAVTGYENVPARKAGRKFEGEPEELAKQLFEVLRNEAKVL